MKTNNAIPEHHRAAAARRFLPAPLLVCGLLAGCPSAPFTPLPFDDAPYVEQGTRVDCSTLPELCGLPLHDLGGGEHPNAFHLVFIGDGWAEDRLDLFRTHVQLLIDGYRRAPGGAYDRSPELFHFWRIDIPSRSALVDDDDTANTPLAAHVRPPDICGGTPFIAADEARFDLAWRAANVSAVEDAVPDVQAVTFVFLSRDSNGRANATPYGNVRLSSRDSPRTLRHELGHALFRLGDEYEEFSTCAALGAAGLHDGPATPLTEVGLLSTPNVTASLTADKWAAHAETIEDGGARYPCLSHPTSSCLMFDSAASFCPVCAATVDEHLALRRCEPDTHAPVVAIAQQWVLAPDQSHIVVAAAVYDERGDAVITGWTVGDDSAVPSPHGDFLIVDLVGRAPGDEIRAVAEDAAGNVALSPPFVLPADAFPSASLIRFESAPGGGQTVSTTLSAGFAKLRIQDGTSDAVVVPADRSGEIQVTLARERSTGTLQAWATSFDGRLEVAVDATQIADARDARPPAADVPLGVPPRIQVAHFDVARLDQMGKPVQLVAAVTPDIGVQVVVSGCAPLTEIRVFVDGLLHQRAPIRSQSSLECDLSNLRLVPFFIRGLSGVPNIRVELDDQYNRTRSTHDLWTPQVTDDCLDGVVVPTTAPGIFDLVPLPSVHDAIALSDDEWVSAFEVYAGGQFNAPIAMLPPSPAGSLVATEAAWCSEGMFAGRSTLVADWDNRPPVALAIQGAAIALDESGVISVAIGDSARLGLDVDDFGAATVHPDAASSRARFRDLGGNFVDVDLTPLPLLQPRPRLCAEGSP